MASFIFFLYFSLRSKQQLFNPYQLNSLFTIPYYSLIQQLLKYSPQFLLTHSSQSKFLLQIFTFIIFQTISTLIILLYNFIQKLMVKVLFPSRPKAQSQIDKNIQKQRQQEKKMFANTIKDMRQMVQKHLGNYHKDTLGMLKKNTKMPYTHLMGRRNKIAEKYSTQKARARQENIQYDSSLQLLNSNIVQKSKQQKDEFLKNKYKYAGEHLSEGRLGRQSDGMLTLSKKDIARINGKQFNPGQKKQQAPHKSFKHKKVRKGNKGKGKKGGRRH